MYDWDALINKANPDCHHILSMLSLVLILSNKNIISFRTEIMELIKILNQGYMQLRGHQVYKIKVPELTLFNIISNMFQLKNN